MNKHPILYDEFINPNNILSLENVEENQGNYILKAPRKGKIIKGPVCTAYKRQNLGSIPRKTEKILIDEFQPGKTSRGFLTQTERFSAKNQFTNSHIPGPGSYQTQTNFIHVVNDTSYHSSKGFGNGFASNTSRFEDLKEYYDKYLPGPGSYKNDESTALITSLNKTLSYKSLYSKSSNKSLKNHTPIPGPGTYNPILVKKDELEGINHYFKSTETRFKNIPKSALGPGKYFRDKFDIVPKSPDKNLDDEGNNRIVDKNVNNTSSYFFKNPLEKNKDILDKYIYTKNPLNLRKIKTPGPGQYDIRKDFNFEKRENPYVEIIKNNVYKKRLNTAANIQPKPLIDLKHPYTKGLGNDLEIVSPNDKKKFAVTGFTFPKVNAVENNKDDWMKENNVYPENMASPKSYPDYFGKKNVPGPAYYNPLKKPTKVYFNWNLEKKWI